jgi:glutamate-1-semialdehyde aminotransferase
MTLGKGIGGGVPLAALLATKDASCFEHGDQGGTFNGNPLMCAAGLAVLEEISKPEFLKAVADAGLFLESELQKLSARHGLGEVRGRVCCSRSISNCRSALRSWPRRWRTASSSTRRSPMRCASCRRSTSRARRYR